MKHYDNRQLTDKYTMYQHLMDYWAETRDDFYELAADGWQAGNEVKRIQKKKQKKARKKWSKRWPALKA